MRPGTSRRATRGAVSRPPDRGSGPAFTDCEPADARDAYLKALRRLSRRDYSARDLRLALSRDGFEADTVDAVLALLRTRRYQDDDRYAERFAKSALARRRLGAVRIGCELKARGLTAGAVRRALTVATIETPEGEVLEAQARRYWRTHARIPVEVRLRRLWAHLIRRGFTFSTITERMRALHPELLDEIDSLAAMTTS